MSTSFLVLVLAIFLGLASAQALNESRRKLGAFPSCNSGNLIDDCWACDPEWYENRQYLAKCGQGFGKNALGGYNGDKTIFYEVRDDNDRDVVTPDEHTLRYAVLMDGPVWITFSRDMTITLREELIMTPYKTIDARGYEVILQGNSGITVQNVTNIIIHGLKIRNMKPSGKTNVRSSPDHYGYRDMSDGDGISIFHSTDVWVDHCTMKHCSDGLIDVVEASTGVTISNNRFSHHDEVMLMGHNDGYPEDRVMKVTVVYNVFGRNLTQRMPRCRFGEFHVLNNNYPNGWDSYAIGGSADPTIVSRCNVFVAPDDLNKKFVTYHEGEAPSVWGNYRWSSGGDAMYNGAYFQPSGKPFDDSELSMEVKNATDVARMTHNAGAFEIQP